MTLNSRLATAAAAMVQRMMIRSIPRVFLPPSPFRKGSRPVVDMVDRVGAAIAGRIKLSKDRYRWNDQGAGLPNIYFLAHNTIHC